MTRLTTLEKRVEAIERKMWPQRFCKHVWQGGRVIGEGALGFVCVRCGKVRETTTNKES